MIRYSSFKEYGFHFEVKVPTTIFELKVGVIRAYKGKRFIDEVYFGLKSMPEWHTSGVMLKKHDEKLLERKTEELFKKLKLK